MLILLPPSEGKTPPTDEDSPRLELESLLLPRLAEERTDVLDSLIAASGRQDAQQVLKVGAKVMDEVAANKGLSEAPTAPAHEVYSGVLFDALAAQDLTADQLNFAATHVLIFSGLFGVTGFADRIPAYRCAMDLKLPGIGNLGAFWKRHLASSLSGLVEDQLVVDCRSSSYAKAFRPPPEQTLAMNSFTEKHGRRTVVTHFAKAARGELSGMLLRAASRPETVDDVAHLASERWTVEVRPASGTAPHQLNLISSS